MEFLQSIMFQVLSLLQAPILGHQGESQIGAHMLTSTKLYFIVLEHIICK